MKDTSEPGLPGSGKNEVLATGSQRDARVGKGRYDLVSPAAMRRLAARHEAGAAKYGVRDWEKGQPLSFFLDSALRHLFAYLEGDESEDHLAAADWNVQGAIHVEEACKNGALPVTLLDTRRQDPPGTSEDPVRLTARRFVNRE